MSTRTNHPQLPPHERARLYALIHEKLDLGDEDWPDEVNSTTVVRELPGVDSLKLLRLLGAIELDFRVNLGFEAIPQVQTVQDVERLICASRASRDAARGAHTLSTGG
ncbi:acyl carrier protein [Streptomyces sp. HSW2009]|uniref:acyl carrier protein n=1 Tax=Streptomyces sp. HSW2009 TaxID=3142890 RepID=UPI0032EAC3B3